MPELNPPTETAADHAVRPGRILRALSEARGATLPDFAAPDGAGVDADPPPSGHDIEVLPLEGGGARIRVRCECGRTVEIECEYPDG